MIQTFANHCFASVITAIYLALQMDETFVYFTIVLPNSSNACLCWQSAHL